MVELDIADVQAKLSKALGVTVDRIEQMFDFDVEKGIVKPTRFLGRETFITVLNVLRDLGFEYVSAGKDSHFRIPTAEAPKPTTETKRLADISGKVFPAEAPPTPKRAEKIDLAPINAIDSRTFQPRLDLESGIPELAESIEKYGILQPILVRRKDDMYEMVAGGRRLRAAKKAGLSEVPAIVRELTDQQAMEISLIENLHRRDLTDYEKARHLREIMRKFPEVYPTQAVLAQRFRLSEGRISQLLSMFDVIEKDEIFKRLKNLKPTVSAIEVQAIASLPSEEHAKKIQEIAEKIEEGKVPSVREVKEIVKPPKEAPLEALPPQARMPEAPAPEGAPEVEVPEEVPETKPEPIDTGVKFHCKICNMDYMIIHVAPGKHRFEKVIVDGASPNS